MKSPAYLPIQSMPVQHSNRDALGCVGAINSKTQFQEFFMRLDGETRRHRFGHALSNDALRAHAIRALRTADCVLGAAVDGKWRGAIELYCSESTPWIEGALVVERDWRRRGLGWALLVAAIQRTRTMNGPKIRIFFARDNWPMRNLANKANARFDLVLDEFCADFGPVA